MARHKNQLELKLERHHIIPKSRKGNGKTKNIAYVESHLHKKYHSLFINKTPEEIVDYLNYKFWNNNYEVYINQK